MRPRLLKLVHCAPVEMNCSPVASHFVGKGHFVEKKVHKINEKSLKKRQIELKNVAPVHYILGQ